MSLFKMKRGQESKVDSLAKEDGSLIFSLNGANDSTLRLDQSIDGTVQRLGVAVDKAKDANSVIDYNEPTRHIKIGYAGAGLSTANLTHIAGYTNNGTQIKDVSKDVLKSWLGTMGSADNAKVIEPFENATADASRNVWFSDSGKRNKPVYNDNFKYNPVSQILTTNINGSAAKWTTARTVTLNGDLSGSFSIDGSGNVSANIYDYYSTVQVGNTNNYPYHRIAKLDTISGSYVDKSTLLYLSQGYQGGRFGIIRVALRTNNVSGGAKSRVEARWLIRSGFNTDDIKIGHYSIAGKTYADVFYRSNSSYAGCVIRDLGSSSRNNIGRCWTLINSKETENTTTSDKKTSTECWATIELAGKDLHNQAYSEIISSSDNGTVSYANNSGALGGSSLSQVLASAGGGNVFTGLDTTTNNKIKLTRANGGTVEKTINNVSNASSANFASTAILTAYPQGFESRVTSATWGNTTGTFLTGWHTSSGGDVAFMNNNPSSGKVSMKLDGYFYQNEGKNRVLDTSDAANYVKKAGDTMTGLLTLKIGNQQGIKLGSAWMTSASSTNGEFVFQNGHLRFGASDWNYDRWAGLKYDADNKYVYLGIADGTIFTANNPQNDGLLFTPGISGIYVGGTTTTRVATSSDLSNYVAKSGDTMTGTLKVNAPIFGYRYGSNNDSPAFVFDKPGNYYTGIGAHGTDTIYFSAVNISGLTWNNNYKQKWVFNGSVSATTVTADYFDGTIANATSAKNASHLGGKVASDYALKTDLSGNINALSAKRLPSYQSVSVANSFFYRYGTAGNTSDGGAWTGFPSTTLYSEASTANGFGSALFQKKVGVLHLAAGSSAHDLVFQAGGTNGGIAYVATGRNPAYVLDTLNYKDKAYTFNKLTATSTFTATGDVIIDGGSY